MKYLIKAVIPLVICLVLFTWFRLKPAPVLEFHDSIQVYEAYFKEEQKNQLKYSRNDGKAVLVDDFNGSSMAGIRPGFRDDNWSSDMSKAVKQLVKNQLNMPDKSVLKDQLGEYVEVVTQGHLDEIFQPVPMMSWGKFYEAHPNSSGIYYLSGVGFYGEYAAIFVDHGSNNLAASASIVIFQYSEGSWSVIDELILWVS